MHITGQLYKFHDTLFMSHNVVTAGNMAKNNQRHLVTQLLTANYFTFTVGASD